ncbi:MAG: DNA polymerase III subunit epsilon [Sulfurimonas sp. RIFCSPLOWO2_12_FULL_36_74]|uniref:3'-5' exonuclease n=1 Tax=Sulfurimonas sp. RIFCSPLOWO2_12_36_12 TaxID=1802253 RepID=UPI0008ADE99A|nr:3'-5' exonuclease [Sulfurimonas sp. RIFCSPLOWO2_12_36_12]OHE00385.1 MAG: DNA polymerase III subunit epsilon [Sulfurimonas sp. RIFCSPLOWO2_12_36_12]OHE02319.1 MAG: DNA polymerase III subunit epsilon [Sulfurimonas sp. RIFCSPLOWO2_12_FULL_36_74]
MIHDEPNFSLDAKSIHKLSSNGLSSKTLKEQIDEDLDFLLQLWHSQGLEIVKHQGSFYFATKFIPVKDAIFCIVDIETNGSKIDKHQIIEIAVVKVKNGKIIDSYESLVNCKEINQHITEITGISADDTKDAPNLKKVMYDFKTFLGDAVFVAHDVKFDYKFISLSMQKIGLAPLLNRSLCSLSLAERTIESYRYALSYLNVSFNLNPEATHHRAMSDVMTTYELFKLSLSNLDEGVVTVEDLIKFSKEAKRLKKPKFDPLMESQE